MPDSISSEQYYQIFLKNTKKNQWSDQKIITQ